MSIFQIDPSSPINDLSSIRYRLNLQDTFASRQTEFGSIDPADYVITRYNNLVNFPKVNNKTKNIRLTLTPSAVRGNKFDFYNGGFDNGFPLNSNKTFCGDKLSTVFNTGNEYWTKSFSTKYSYPIVSSYNRVLANSLNNCNDEPPSCDIGYIYNVDSQSCVPCSGLCAPGQIYDPGSCLCVDPPECRIQLDCPPITIPAIKNVITGYAFYLDAIRDINIPGVGNVRASCSGGHVCCRTLFRPKLVKADSTEVLANRNICMDNVDDNGCTNDGSQIPMAGFTPITAYERSDTFTITLDNPLHIQNSSFYLNCEYTACHNGVTFIVLVAELASSTDKIVIFASCVSPGAVNGKLIGTVDCPGEEGPCGDYAYSCYDGVCKNVIDMGGNIGEGLWLNDQYCGGQCDPTTPTPTTPTETTPTTTPTPPPPCEDDEGCCLSTYCSLGSGVYNVALGLTTVYDGCGSTNYTCCNGLSVEITSSTEAGFSSSITGVPIYDVTITVS
jgi:hypothetical protein